MDKKAEDKKRLLTPEETELVAGGMMRALWSSASGMKGQQMDVDDVADNIVDANLNINNPDLTIAEGQEP